MTDDVTKNEEKGATARVMSAVLDELSRHGYEGLRVEAVAHRAGVAKTTVYRNWKTRAQLVHATMQHIPGFDYHVPDTGNLRQDMRGIALDFSSFAHSTNGLAAMRLFVSDSGDPELEALLEEVRDQQNTRAVTCIERAIARQELPLTLDARMVSELFAAAVFGRTLVNKKRFEGQYIEDFLDVFLAGIRWAPHKRNLTSPVPIEMPRAVDGYVMELSTHPLVDVLATSMSARGRAPLYGRMLGLMLCARYALCAQDIEQGLHISKGSVSRHLRALRDEGMIAQVHPEDRATYYVLAPGAWSSHLLHAAEQWGDLYDAASVYLERSEGSEIVHARLEALCAACVKARDALISVESS